MGQDKRKGAPWNCLPPVSQSAMVRKAGQNVVASGDIVLAAGDGLMIIADRAEAITEIAAALMGLPFEEVLTEVKKTGRAAARSATRVITGEIGAQRSVVVERKVIRRFGNDKRTGT